MKQRIIIALALAIVLLFSACSDSSTSETIENFKKSLCDSNYTQATTIYNDAEETEKSELQAVIKEVANTTIIDYLNDTIDYSKAISTLEKIQQIIDDCQIPINDFSAYTEQLTEANNSKIAYDSGMSLMTNKNYKSAIDHFKLVIQSDCRYQLAQEKINESLTLFKSTLITEATNCANNGDYTTALQKIDEALALLPSDNELKTLQTTYQSNEINKAITDASTIFVNPETDYQAAIDIIRTATQKYPDETTLQEKLNYYLEFEPVMLSTLKPYTCNYTEIEPNSYTDTLGNTYDNSFCAQHISMHCSQTYAIDKKYNVFSGSIALNEYAVSYPTEKLGAIEIYGDGKLLKKIRPQKGDRPSTFSINLTGISNLEIKFISSGFDYGCTNQIIIGTPSLQKTIK